MENQSKKLDSLLQQLETLLQKQASFQNELDALKSEISKLKPKEKEPQKLPPFPPVTEVSKTLSCPEIALHKKRRNNGTTKTSKKLQSLSKQLKT